MSACTQCSKQAPARDDAAPAHDEPVVRRIARKASGSIADSLADGASIGATINAANRSASTIADEGFSGPGAELSDRAFHEQSFGKSFADVRVYTDAAAADACKRMNARAYTVGNKIAFADASLASDRALVAHELTHVGQHAGGGGGADADGIDRSGEAEAERVEAAVADGKPASTAATPNAGGDGDPNAAKAPARKAPALDSPWGASLTMDAGELKSSGSYQFAGRAISMPVPGVPGVFMYFSPSFAVKFQYGSNMRDSYSVSLGVEGGVEAGVSLGECNYACIFVAANGSATGALEYRQEGQRWHLQGDVKLETFFSAGVKIAPQWGVYDNKVEFGKVELGRLVGIRFVNEGLERDKLGWQWGPDVLATFNQFKGYMNKARRLIGK